MQIGLDPGIVETWTQTQALSLMSCVPLTRCLITLILGTTLHPEPLGELKDDVSVHAVIFWT